MPNYMIRARFTADAWEALYTSSVDRREIISRTLEDTGGRLIDYYFNFGDADVIVITEAPDNVTAASAVIAVTRSGAITDVRTTVLMSYEESIEALRHSGAMVIHHLNRRRVTVAWYRQGLLFCASFSNVQRQIARVY